MFTGTLSTYVFTSILSWVFNGTFLNYVFIGTVLTHVLSGTLSSCVLLALPHFIYLSPLWSAFVPCEETGSKHGS